MKYVFYVSLFFLNSMSFAAQRADYYNMPPMVLITTRIVISPPQELKERLDRYGLSDLAQKTNIVEKLGGQTKTLFTLIQELEQTFKQYGAENTNVKPQKVFITCVVNDLEALKKLQTYGLLR